ncbi:coproporphyrinogen oxidase [Hasllibacter halocynthiae]|uniref:coproporphyrinogen oxidase n=1 Tax=Hasllibacter halocynthiae TaxID=595589 RepID=A0A2T0X499_9RHOB|nr:oxygen-dependent coproporphyrinogen oxidase [Hasllibacter halocynthiae]PRY93694.1 coproporphyrinogen oxidase [Hasllibacter halocynthiae]
MNAHATDMETERAEAAAWFKALRGEIVAAFEALEARFGTGARFEVTPTARRSEDGSDAGGGIMSVLRGGAVFEKVGVNWSEVHGVLQPRAQAAMAARKGIPGMAEDPRFWASGISLVAHMANPRVPAVHMNTRMFWTPHAHWFGGGADLNPAIPFEEDTAHFHRTLEEALAPWAGEYGRMKDWADEYFFVPHRGRARGVGGVFYDDLSTGDLGEDFALTRAVGSAFLPAYLPLVEKRQPEPWTEGEREAQLVHRGLYAEYNLVYDRGTKFGLETGHDANAVLMSLPPVAKWT